MICALRSAPSSRGTFEQFREAFMQREDPDNPPPGSSAPT
jgi:hypothetical protein